MALLRKIEINDVKYEVIIPDIINDADFLAMGLPIPKRDFAPTEVNIFLLTSIIKQQQKQIKEYKFISSLKGNTDREGEGIYTDIGEDNNRHALGSVSNSCVASKVIVFGHPTFDVKSGKEIDYHVNNIYVDSLRGKIQVTFEEHGTMKIHTVDISIQHAEEIGFINLSKLSNYC